MGDDSLQSQRSLPLMAPSRRFSRSHRANDLWFLFCALFLAGPLLAQIRPQAPPVATVAAEARHPSPSSSGTMLYHGVERTYELINGLAIHDGDMVLSPPGRAPRPPENRRPSKQALDDSIPRRGLSPVTEEGLWPDGVIPYVIDPGFTEQALRDIQTAIDHWNVKTVITLKPRMTEPDFVRFQPVWACRADLGRKGGEQSIWLRSSNGCGIRSTIHEIGHAVGMGHEHQRVDRDDFIMVSSTELYGGLRYSYVSDAPVGGPYDYASVMHYLSIETIPPGMLVGGEDLSPGDIDGVARLYGQPPTYITVSTNPPGLELIVDGQRIMTPARFDWLPGSEHVLEAPLLQAVAGSRYLFGRWNDRASRRRTVTADPAITWIEANYIVQRSVTACADPPDAGKVEVRPASPDSFHTIGSPVTVEASPAPDGSRAFMEWRTLSEGGHIRGGGSANPGSIALSPEAKSGIAVRAHFSASPLFRVDSNLEGQRLVVNGDWQGRALPWAFPASEFPTGFTVEVPEVVAEPYRYPAPLGLRYRFSTWSDGGSRSRTVPVPASGGSLTLNLAPEYRLLLRVNAGYGSVQASPESDGGFYPAGTQVTVTAVPDPGRHFAGWMGQAFNATEPVATVLVDEPKYLEALFTRSEPLRTGETTEVVLPASRWPELRFAENGHNVIVPADAIELVIKFHSTLPSAEVDLYARRDYEVWWSYGGDGSTRVIEADFESKTPGANERLVIDRASNPPLTSGLYFIALDTQPSPRNVRGTLSVRIKRSGIAQASPRAFTFSSPGGIDPAPQTARIFYAGNGPSHFRIESDQAWLTAHPREWTQTGPRIEELSISINSTTLLLGTHRGTLRIVIPDPERPSGATFTGIEFPVAFVNVGQFETIPAVSGVEISSVPKADGTYGAREEIEVQVHFNRPVRVTGIPELALAIGGQSRRATWNRHRGTRSCGEAYLSLAFAYTVQGSDADLDGVGVPADGLTLNGGTIQNSRGAAAHLALGRFAISDALGHSIDGSHAPAPTVGNLWFGNRPQEGDTYGAGEPIDVGVEFSVDVEVKGSPQLALAVGDRRVQAAFRSHNDSSLWFRYVVQAEDQDADGVGVPADALSLNGGTIRSLAGTEARLALADHALATDPERKVNGSFAPAPAIKGLSFGSRPQESDTYSLAETILVGLHFGIDVEVTGRPQLALAMGDRRVQAAFRSHNDSSLWFRYVVQAEDQDADGVGVPADALSLNGGTIRSLAGTEARLALADHALAADPERKVNGSLAPAPAIQGLWFASRPQEGDTYGLAETILVGLRFGVDVEVTGRPQLALAMGDRRVQAALSDHSGRSLWFRHIVQAEDQDADGVGVPTDALSLNGGTIRSLAGTEARLALADHALAADPERKVNGSLAPAPAIQGLWFASRPQEGDTYGLAETILVGLRFGVDVEVTGRPQLALAMGDRRVQAALSDHSGRSLWFRHVVQAEDQDADGIGVPTDALSLNGGTIRSLAGTEARLTLADHALAADPERKVNGSLAPAVRGL